jgi:hypothetical protein
VEVEPAHQSDAKAIIPAIESANQSDLAPKELLVNGCLKVSHFRS